MRSVIFALSVSFVTVIVLADIDGGSTTAQSSLSLRSATVRNDHLWGRNAFVPDWQRAEMIDAVASEHFLEHYWPAFSARAGYPAAPAKLQPTSPTDPDLQVFIGNYWTPVYPEFLPARGDHFNEAIHVRAAQGESEPIVIGVRSDNQPRVISVIASAFTGEVGEFPASGITNRLMLSYEARERAGKKASSLRVQPMLLLKTPENRWRFPPNYSLAYVIDFHIPAEQQAGIYQGDITILVDNVAYRTVHVRLEVLPFRLKVNAFHAGAFGTTFDIWEGGFSGYTEEMIEMDSRYGLNLAGGFFNKGNEVPFHHISEYALTVDTDAAKFRKFNATMKTLARFGMGDVAFWNWGASGNVGQFNKVLKSVGYGGIESPSGKRGFAAICKALKDAERIHGWPEFVINPFDEALKDQTATRNVIDALPYVHAASPQTRLYMTEWRPGYARHYQSSGQHLRGNRRPREREARALVDSGEAPRLNFDVIGANTLSEEARRLQDRLGGELWHYGGASEFSLQARLAYGFVPWIVRAEAALVWANYKGDLNGSGWTIHYPMPLDPSGRKNRDTRGPVIPGARSIAIREGIDDRKYIETLRYHATRLNSQENLDYLDSLRRYSAGELSNLSTVGGLENTGARFVREPEIESYRSEIRERILSLLQQQTTPAM